MLDGNRRKIHAHPSKTKRHFRRFTSLNKTGFGRQFDQRPRDFNQATDYCTVIYLVRVNCLVSTVQVTV